MSAEHDRQPGATAQPGHLVVLAGGTGDLGGRIAAALGQRRVACRVLVRSSVPPAIRSGLEANGAALVEIDDRDRAALRRACEGATCVVSALNGLQPVIIGLQGRLLDAAIASGVGRFIASDFSLDFTRTRPGGNRNLDLRRAFMTHIDAMPIAATSILNGAFADLLTGQAPIILRNRRRILFWGSADQAFDFTAKDDVADYAAHVATDPAAPRILRIAGFTVTPRALAAIMTELTGRTYGLWRAGGTGLLSLAIGVARTLTPRSEAIFPPWQGMQYLRDMSTGRGKLDPLDNDRYGSRRWTTAREVLAAR